MLNPSAGQSIAVHPTQQVGWRKGLGNLPSSWLLGPSVLVALAMLLPVAYLILRSVGASESAWDLLFRLRTLSTLGRTALLGISVTGISILLAVPLAWLTTRTDLPFRRFWGVVSVLPLVIPSYVGAFLVVSALGPRGLVQQILETPFGVDRLPSIYGFPGATITLAFLTYPYILLTVRGAIQNLDPSLEEAARGLGHGRWQTFWRVVVPQLRPAIAAGSLLVGLYALSDFGAVSLLRYETFTWSIYQQYQTAFDRSIAALLSLVLVALATVILLMESWSRGRLKYFRTGSGVARRQRVLRLERWKWPAVAFCAAVAALSLALPFSVLAYWLVRGVIAGEPLFALWTETRNSFYASGITAAIAAAFALPFSVLLVRYPGRLSRLLESTSYVGYALPGIVIALALVFFGANYARPVYQTVWLLVFAYLILHFPVALGAIRAAVLQISPRLEEAARGLGLSRQRAMLKVTIPLLWPGVLAGAALVFLVTMKELPATLILGPLGFKTLATAIWSASSEAFFARAAAAALLLILLSSLPTAFLLVRLRSQGDRQP
ncbi:MAG: iron ABC transporter permease [Chloroflexi bacterium]|nr:iron ABC transporter permease [Chloroflexota bacterium]